MSQTRSLPSPDSLVPLSVWVGHRPERVVKKATGSGGDLWAGICTKTGGETLGPVVAAVTLAGHGDESEVGWWWK